METGTGDDGRMSARPRAMVKPLVILFVAVALVMGGIYGWHLFVAKKFIGPMLKAMATAPQTVSTVIAVSTRWQAQTQALGSLRAVRGADLAAQAAGVVDDHVVGCPAARPD